MRLLFLALVLGLFAAPLVFGGTYHENSTVKVAGDANVKIQVLTDQAIRIDSQYYTILLRDGDCTTEDIFLWCLDSLTYDPVENYPYNYGVELTVEKQCEDCFAYGQKCEEKIDCQNYCVHAVCRPKNTFCGDTVCDDGEESTCRADCPLPEPSTQPDDLKNLSIEPEELPQEHLPKQESENVTIHTSENATPELLPEVPSENRQSTTTAVDTQQSTENSRPFTSSDDEPNLVAGIAVLIGGVLALVFVFMHGRKKKDTWKPRPLKREKEDGSMPAVFENEIPNQDEDEEP